MGAAYLNAPDIPNYKSQCVKVPYETRAIANGMREKLLRKVDNPVERGHGELQAYRCLKCGYWHVGNSMVLKHGRSRGR